jgi:hypothetical protein
MSQCVWSAPAEHTYSMPSRTSVSNTAWDAVAAGAVVVEW